MIDINYKISIIVPIYNSEKLLEKCFCSLINQTYNNLEIILVNDGSTDRSLMIANKFANIDNRIIVINKENGGVASARNKGLEVATGDYIGFVDSDDYISLDMYEKLIYAIYNHDADIAECGYYRVSYNNEIIEAYSLKDEVIHGNFECSKKYLTKDNTTNFNVNKLYKKHIFNDIRYPNLKYSEDYIVNVKAHYFCIKKVIISDCCYYYYDNINSATNDKFSKAKFDIITSGKEALKFHEDKYSDLKKYIYIYLLNNLRKIYEQLYITESIKKREYMLLLLKEYRKYYSYVRHDIYKLVRFKTCFALQIFYLSPKTYYWINHIKKSH